MNNRSLIEKYEETIKIIEKIQYIGFPNAQNIEEIEGLVKQLQDLVSHFEQFTMSSCANRLCKIIEEIKTKIVKYGEIKTMAYIKLNDQLIVLKENIIYYLNKINEI